MVKTLYGKIVTCIFANRIVWYIKCQALTEQTDEQKSSSEAKKNKMNKAHFQHTFGERQNKNIDT